MTQGETRPKRRWRRRLLALVMAVAAGLLFRGPILRSVARNLVAETPPVPADYVVLLGGEHVFDRAAELHREGLAPRFLLLRGRRLGRLQRLGILPPHDVLVRRELAQRGVEPDLLTVVQGNVATARDEVCTLRDWLDRQPPVQLTVLCNRFQSRRWRHLFDTELSPGASARVAWIALPLEAYDETNWWRRREGWVGLGEAYMSYAFAALGWKEQVGPEWDPDAYDRELPPAP